MSGEKTEQPTPKKLRDARKKGQVVSLIRKDKATKAHRMPTGALRQDSNLLVAIMARPNRTRPSCSNRFLMPVPVICVVTRMTHLKL
mgnify:CR=1 FL=1